MTLLDECLAAAADLPAPPPTVWMFEADYLDLLARLRQPVTRVLTPTANGGYRVKRAWEALGLPGDPPLRTLGAVLFLLPQDAVRLGVQLGAGAMRRWDR